METVNSPRMLFRQIDISAVDGGINIAEDSGEKTTVNLREFETKNEINNAAFDEIKDAASVVETLREIPERFNKEFTQDGFTYFANTDRMGYELIRSGNQKELGFCVISDNQVLKVKTFK